MIIVRICLISILFLININTLFSQEYTIGIPEVHYTEIEDYYFVGQEVKCTTKVYSYGLVDDLCAIYYEIFKDDFSSPVVNLTQYGNAKFTIRSQGTNYVTQQITEGSGYFSVKPLFTTYKAFTLGIFDNWCVSRNRPVALSMTFTEPGLYKFNAEIQKCSNSGTGLLGQSFTSNGNEGCGEAGTSHADKAASSCNNPQALFSDEIIISVCDENQIAFIDGETEYCSGDELFLTYSIGNNDDGIDEFLLPEWVNVDINLDTKTASLSGIIPDYDEENSIIEFEVKSISSYNPIACPGASINQYITIKPSHLKTLNIEICEGESYEFAGSLYTESTNTSYNYINEFACDSIVNLNLIVNPTYTETISIGICDNEIYEFAGVELNETGEYSHTFESINGCDSIVNLNLLVYPTYTETLNVEICEGEYYEFAGQNLSESGEYSHSFESIFACDSIVNLNLTLNPITITNLYEEICEGDTYFFNNEELSEAGEYQMLIENIYACNDITNLNLEVNPNYNIILNKQICEGDSYEFDGITYLENTNITKTFTSFYGCDSIINLNLEFVELFEINLNESICEGEVYEFAGEELSETGVFSHTYESINGCDSVVNLNLIVNPTYNENLNIEICDNEVYEFAGEELNETGEYSYTFESINGCDSIVNLNLIVNPTYNENLNIEICDNEVYYFAGEELNETGEYSYTFESINGCDSIVNLNLIVFPAYNETMNIEICQSESYEFFGEILTQTGNYSQILQTINNCDSIIVLNLTVHPVNTFNMTKHICEGEVFTFHGQDYSEQGNYTIELENNYGCFNIWHLELIITPSEIVFEEIICEGESYVFNNEELYEAGEYSYTEVDEWNCATRTQLNLTLAPNYEIYLNESINHGEIYYFGDFELSQAGEYSYNFESEYACDSIVNLSLTYTTNIKSNFNLENLISIYPNPTNSMLYIEIDDKINNEITINITDITGQIIIDKRRFEKFTPINLSDYMTGVYFLNIYSKEKLILTKIIIKN